MYCPKCGAQNNDGSAFCLSCGTPLSAPSPQQPDPQFQQQYQMPEQKFQQPQFPQQYQQQTAYPQPHYQPRPDPSSIPFARKVNWIALGGAILMIISIFLPIITATASAFGYGATQTMSLIEMSGTYGWISVFWIIVIIDALAAIGFSIPGLHVVVIVMGGLSVFWSIVTSSVMAAAAQAAGSYSYRELISGGVFLGVGAFIMMLGASAILAGGIIGTVRKKRRGSMF